MLQPYLVTVSVAIAKFKQVRAGKRTHFAFARIDFANDIRFAVGGVNNFAITRDSRRLSKPCLRKRSIATPFMSRPRKHSNYILVEIKLPNLMRPGHGDVEAASDKLQVPWRIQINTTSSSFAGYFPRLSTSAGNRLD